MERVRITRPTKRTHLLPTESVEEYARDRCAIADVIQPCDAIEQIYCDDFVYECQQMLRLQRWSTATLKTALVDAVYAVLRQLNELESIDVKFVIGKWSNDPVARAMVSDILAKHGLDDSAIEAEAFRRCSRDLIIIDQLLTSHGSRRDKALQLIAFHREMRARQRQHAAKNVVEGEVARIEQLPTTHRQGKNGH